MFCPYNQYKLATALIPIYKTALPLICNKGIEIASS